MTFAEVRERVDEHFQIGHFQISRKGGMEILLRPHDGPSTGSVRIFAIAASLGLLVRARWIRLAGGTEHVCALAQALASGACWKLEELYLPRSKIGDGGVLALCDAGLQGALSRLHRLHLGGNLISDAGACALARTISSGALSELDTLWLHKNEISDEGLEALADAARKGKLAACHFLLLADNPASVAAQESLQRAVSAHLVSPEARAIGKLAKAVSKRLRWLRRRCARALLRRGVVHADALAV